MNPLFAYEAPMDQGGGSAPGTAEGTGTPDQQSAGTLNTDTGSGTPESVPYSRFKEVNDAYRPFRDLEQEYGADADSVRQLLDWDRNFSVDPSNAWLAVGEAYLDQLPEPVANAIREARGDGRTPSEPKTGTENEPPQREEPPQWFKDWVGEEFGQIRETVTQREEREAEAAREAVLDQILEDFEAADEREGIVWATGENADSQARALRLHYVRMAAEDTESLEEILPRARQTALAFRSGVLQHAVSGRGTGAPRAVPSGGPSTGSNEFPVPKTLREATRLAEADLQAAEKKGG